MIKLQREYSSGEAGIQVPLLSDSGTSATTLANFRVRPLRLQPGIVRTFPCVGTPDAPPNTIGMEGTTAHTLGTEGLTMGYSPSATIFYGYDLGTMEDEELEKWCGPSWWADDEGGFNGDIDWEDVAAERLGWTETAPHPLRPSALGDYTIPYAERQRLEDEYRKSPEFLAWSADWRNRNDILRRSGVKLSSYGHENDTTCWTIEILASHFSVYGWTTEALESLSVDPAWPGLLERFMDLMELPVDGFPGWHVTVSYG